MTVEQAKEILAGNPSQEQLLQALLVLAEQDETAYVAALPRAVELLSEQNPGENITREAVNQIVRQVQSQSPQAAAPETQEVTLGETESLPDTSGLDTGGVSAVGAGGIAAPPPPEEEQPEQELPFIGVPPGFQAPNRTGHPTDPAGIEPRYKAGDEFNPASRSTTEIRRRQKELERAGLLEPGSYTPGFWDQASANALQEAMGYANRQGTDVEQVIIELQSMPRQLKPEEQFQPPPELTPDPANIEQRVKSEFRSRLGRDPTAQELARFGGYLTGQYGAAYDEQVAMARAAFEGEDAVDPQVVSHPAQPVETFPPESNTRSTFTDVDPVARFRQLFEQKFGAELDFVEGQGERRENMQNVMSSLTTMGRLIG